MIDITNIIAALAGLCIILISIYCVPYIKRLKESQNWETMQEIINIATFAAEQLKLTGKIKDKFVHANNLVMDELNKRNIHYDPEIIRDSIESAVYKNFNDKN
ncbi:MAG: phage holin family protein [Firmicutes bacterium]|nr:phage holin family protein [Bacillota bacterium]